MKTTVDKRPWQLSTGRTTPRGSAMWAFEIGGSTHFFTGKYGECAKRALKLASGTTRRVALLP